MKILYNIPLKESYEIYKIDFLLKSDPEVGKTTIVNEIRAIPYVTVVRLNEDPRVAANNTDQVEYTLLSIKFLNIFTSPNETVKNIQKMINFGDGRMKKIEGVYSLQPLFSTLTEV